MVWENNKIEHGTWDMEKTATRKQKSKDHSDFKHHIHCSTHLGHATRHATVKAIFCEGCATWMNEIPTDCSHVKSWNDFVAATELIHYKAELTLCSHPPKKSSQSHYMRHCCGTSASLEGWLSLPSSNVNSAIPCSVYLNSELKGIKQSIRRK